ncbi:single-stranded DNA-binding protein [Arsenicicoccus sp. oral taxon 190]|uniref:single-stranded DNA-binding protein n=1 Tax=Arsenicicoccus sp. oral taxon 190 TaxID=1658671 RepID=UPI0020A04975|nr:single-stranded DNA-binding protein [Arsenicicoccus sp. oral taxon 190]
MAQVETVETSDRATGDRVTDDRATGDRAGSSVVEAVNEVRLVGRVSADPEVRELPSGASPVTLRLVVRRPPDPTARDQGRRPATVDTIDVACWQGRAREVGLVLAAGDVVEVTGALRRRFFRGAVPAQSRYEVEAEVVTIVRLSGDPDEVDGREQRPAPRLPSGGDAS